MARNLNFVGDKSIDRRNVLSLIKVAYQLKGPPQSSGKFRANIGEEADFAQVGLSGLQCRCRWSAVFYWQVFWGKRI